MAQVLSSASIDFERMITQSHTQYILCHINHLPVTATNASTYSTVNILFQVPFLYVHTPCTYIPCVPCVWVLVACGPVATPSHSWSLSARQWESLRPEWEGTPTGRGGCSIYEALWTLKSSWYPSQRVQPCDKRQCTMVVNSDCSLWD